MRENRATATDSNALARVSNMMATYKDISCLETVEALGSLDGRSTRSADSRFRRKAPRKLSGTLSAKFCFTT